LHLVATEKEVINNFK